MNYSIFLDVDKQKRFIGLLDVIESSGLKKYSFAYCAEWIAIGFSMENALPLTNETFFSDDIPLFLQDASPNGWGKSILARNGSSLEDIDVLLSVNDCLRMGALRIRKEGDSNQSLNASLNIPDLAVLPRLKEAAYRVERISQTKEDLLLLMNAGTVMGGARPKVTIKDGKDLYMAKFQMQMDYFRVGCWEATALRLSKLAGMETNDFRVINQDTQEPIILLKRFDRHKKERIHFASALSLGNFQNIQKASYAELGDNIRKLSCDPEKDVYVWWMRMVFNGMIGNTDDHLRNHGFLRQTDGWRLSPAYDINPVPFPYKARSHVLSFMPNDNHKASLEGFNEVGKYLKIPKAKMTEGYQKIGTALKEWKNIAKDYGLTETEIKYFEKAFEHEDSQKLMTMAPPKSSVSLLSKNGM